MQLPASITTETLYNSEGQTSNIRWVSGVQLQLSIPLINYDTTRDKHLLGSECITSWTSRHIVMKGSHLPFYKVANTTLSFQGDELTAKQHCKIHIKILGTNVLKKDAGEIGHKFSVLLETK